MTTTDDWTALSARIRGLIDASHLASQLLSRNLDASPGLIELRKHAVHILKELESYSASLGASSPRVVLAIMRLIGTAMPMLDQANDGNQSPDSRLNNIRSGLVMIAAGEAEVSYLLRDRQAAILSRSERAFVHLQRLIMVDEDVKQKWITAFSAGEPQCEQLGAVHLLGHGIWAFKAHADGGRTDLVYQEQLSNVEAVRRTADGLVLTEWKRLPNAGNPAKWFKDARDQSSRYARGVLAGTELTSYRFAILVSKHQVEAPDDLQVGDITYRHVNIAVEPRTPSKQS